VGDGRNQLEDAYTVVSGEVWMEVSTGNTNLENGGRVDVKDEARSPVKKTART
jgi:hypothetical protein